MSSKNVVLVGFMGTGKSSVGKVLGRKLNREVIDVDQSIEAAERRTIRDIFEKEGERRFREIEKKAVKKAASRSGLVITTGGGAVLDPDNVEALAKTGVLVCLTATPETILKRVGRSKHRPLLVGGGDQLERIKALLDERRPHYEKAEFLFETDGRTPEEVAAMVIDRVSERLQ